MLLSLTVENILAVFQILTKISSPREDFYSMDNRHWTANSVFHLDFIQQ